MKLTKRSFRKIRNQLATKVDTSLILGKNGDLFFVENGNQIFGLDFQYGIKGMEGYFTTNIGMHYSFMPSCMTFERKPLVDFQILDFALQCRLSELVPELQEWCDLSDLNQQSEFIQCNLDGFLAAVFYWNTFFAQKENLIDLLPPNSFESQNNTGVVERGDSFTFPFHQENFQFSHNKPCLIAEDFMQLWGIPSHNVSYMLCAVAIQLEMKKKAENYLQIAKELCTNYSPFIKGLNELETEIAFL